ncbi:MAG: MBOAT family protein [Bacteroidia bacterium]|jgi:D-alanyl-lipoteichoic acid acyltransferase DltB (MBOAT superfamily)|nr:MBOAT family protein [Bacteroidia bacterium]
MLFNSAEFLLFLPVVFVLYWFVFSQKLTWQNILILTASYFFYGWWSWKFMALLMLSTLVDYLYGFGVASENRKRAKLFLWLSIINNLGILFVFKYYNFFAVEFQQLCELFGWHVSPVLLEIGLPIGISFYTFHGMSYVFDIYRKLQQPVRNFVDYAVFVSFFPLLVAGPIERANHLLPQVQRKRTFNYAQAVEGCRLILWGMFKKVFIADNLAPIADQIFGQYSDLNAATLVLGALAFSFQIYGDFSGYSDIALGTAKLFGFELLSNFRFPYFSRDISEFWRRWHISLSSWFRDYLYIPLGGSRNGKLIALRNTLIIFLVSGFWHGASWNFIVWGALHALAFMPLLLLNRNRKYTTEIVAAQRTLPTGKEFVQMIATFCVVTFAWIYFRAPDLLAANSYISHILYGFLQNPLELPTFGRTAFIYIGILLVCDWWLRHDERKLRTPKRFAPLIYIIMALIVIYNLFGADESSSFIYFEF